MLGVIDVGGGLRDIFGAAIFDYCLENDIKFDYGIGVSAGSANIVSYISKQKERNIPFYVDYPARKEYMGFKNLITKGSYLNLEYIYGTLTNEGISAVDYDAFEEDNMPFVIVASDASTGKAHYFRKADISRGNFDPVKASSCIPIINKPYKVNGVPYYDGGVTDPIPIKKALADGCDKLVLILTRPKDEIRTSKKDTRLGKLFLKRKYPQMAAAMAHRALKYNKSIALAKQLEADGRLLILAPESIGKMKLLTFDKEGQMNLYKQGLQEASRIKDFINEK